MSGQGKLEFRGVRDLFFSSSFFFALLNFRTTLVYTFVPFPHPYLFFNKHSLPTEAVTSILVVGWWDKAVSVAQRNPLCVFHSWVSTWKTLPLLSKTIITCHHSLSALISLCLSPPFPPLPSSQFVDVENSGLWNVILEIFSDFDYSVVLRNAFCRG